MRKKLTPIWMLMLCILVTNYQVMAQQFKVRNSFSAKEARSLATQSLPTVLQWIEPEDLALYGFSSIDEFGKINVGKPFLLSAVNDVQGTKDEKFVVEVTSMMLPLILENRVRCFIYVSNQEGRWKAVGVGGNGYVKGNEEIFNRTEDNYGVVIAAHNLNEEFILETNSTETLYRPLFHVNQKLLKSQYNLTEISQLEKVAPKQTEQ